MQINRQFQQFVGRVQRDIWERDFGCVVFSSAPIRVCTVKEESPSNDQAAVYCRLFQQHFHSAFQ